MCVHIVCGNNKVNSAHRLRESGGEGERERQRLAIKWGGPNGHWPDGPGSRRWRWVNDRGLSAKGEERRTVREGRTGRGEGEEGDKRDNAAWVRLSLKANICFVTNWTGDRNNNNSSRLGFASLCFAYHCRLLITTTTTTTSRATAECKQTKINKN